MKNTGKEYEQLIHKTYGTAFAIKGLARSEVLHNAKLPGKTKHEIGQALLHQIDVY